MHRLSIMNYCNYLPLSIEYLLIIFCINLVIHDLATINHVDLRGLFSYPLISQQYFQPNFIFKFLLLVLFSRFSFYSDILRSFLLKFICLQHLFCSFYIMYFWSIFFLRYFLVHSSSIWHVPMLVFIPVLYSSNFCGLDTFCFEGQIFLSSSSIIDRGRIILYCRPQNSSAPLYFKNVSQLHYFKPCNTKYFPPDCKVNTVVLVLIFILDERSELVKVLPPKKNFFSPLSKSKSLNHFHLSLLFQVPAYFLFSLTSSHLQ